MSLLLKQNQQHISHVNFLSINLVRSFSLVLLWAGSIAKLAGKIQRQMSSNWVPFRLYLFWRGGGRGNIPWESESFSWHFQVHGNPKKKCCPKLKLAQQCQSCSYFITASTNPRAESTACFLDIMFYISARCDPVGLSIWSCMDDAKVTLLSKEQVFFSHMRIHEKYATHISPSAA